MATYYVATDGSGDFTTIAQVNVSTFVAGDNILFRKGDIFRGKLIVSNSGTNGLSITYGSYGSGNLPLILGSTDGEAITWNSIGGNKWATDNSTFTPDVAMIFYNTNVNITACVKKTAEIELISNWDFFYDDVNDRVILYHDTGSPELQTDGIEITTPHEGDGLDGIVYLSQKSYIIIQDLELRFGNGYAIKCVGSNSSNIIVDTVTVSYCGGQIIGTTTYGGGIQFNTSDVIVNNCIISQCWDEGIGVEVSKGGTIQAVRRNITFSNNTISYCGGGINIHDFGSTANNIWENINVYGNTISYSGLGWSGVANLGGLGILGASTTNSGALNALTFYSNNIHHNFGKGIYLDGAGYISVYKNNIYSNTNCGIQIYGATDYATSGLFYNNLIYSNDNRGILITSNVDSIYLYNNTIYDNGLTTHEDIELSNSTSNVFIKNNVLWNDGARCIEIAVGSSATLDNNLYYRASGNMIAYNGTNYTLAQFSTYQSATGQDANSIAQDPLLTSAYKLTKDSPCVDAGETLSEVTDDYEGNPRPIGTSSDIGAYEYYSNKI